MLIVLSPAKSLDLDTPSTTPQHTTPDFIDSAAELVKVLRTQSPAEISALMALSDTLSMLNVSRYAHWHPDHSEGRQAVMAFNGDVYTGLDARSLAPEALAFTQRHVRILSGLYGLLRPLDLIHPYRLEMGTKLANPRGKDLYAFWGETITDALNRQLRETGSAALVNLASEEYFKSVKPKKLAVPVLNPVFEDWKNGKYKIISFFAKRARGMMARYAAQHGILDPEQLKEFDVDGYAFEPAASSEREWVFRRKIAQ
ncbi:peroxide stress protein YaaA [Massilia sp. DD77]|uniref:peroxide stress protein YaaA n=1 Tax=Massilia sp. DD77 TaxID=3109349 RepID=UPI003000E538